MSENQLASHTEQMGAHRRDFMRWWMDMLAGPLSESYQTEAQVVKAMDREWSAWMRVAGERVQ